MEEENGSALRPVWFVGASWGGADDQTERFLREGIWEHGFQESQSGVHDHVREMRAGDRVAIKATFPKKTDDRFDTGGRGVSVMRIKAIGTITENPQDGQRVKVAWEPPAEPRDWLFYTYRPTVWKVNPDVSPPDSRWMAEALIAFTFDGKQQDVQRFLRTPYWRKKYRPDDTEQDSYTVRTIWKEGCFLDESELTRLLELLRDKKNLILQGPPGTGKSWLAKRLAYALIGEKDREQVFAVQFHPSLSYEDFVRGFRPVHDGTLKAVDGVFLRAVRKAERQHESQFVVVVIEEINRGNPAQIFGELLTLLEADKRTPEEEIELPYADEKGDRGVYLPDNLYVIGTMNLADRSLAMVDFALRRRFAFATLEPQIGSRWHQWVVEERGVEDVLADDIATRIHDLNDQIRTDRNLGPHFCVGHSFITPPEPLASGTTREWFRNVVETAIGPLLQEYWFDDLKKADDAVLELLKGW